MGLIVEEFGGGFILKTLEYLFHGLPLAGLVQAVEGLPLSSPDHLILEPDTASLIAAGIAAVIAAVIGAIDDLDRLEAMRKTAYERCLAAFRWENRGQRLFKALGERRGIAMAG
jgi:glycosyltransferase involved in cell wall biosynthesis